MTICTLDRVCLFGDVQNGNMRVNPLGRLVENEWVRTQVLRPNVEIDVFGLMPDHLHGIVRIHSPLTESPVTADELTSEHRGRHEGACDAPLRRKPDSLGSVIAGFKASTTRLIGETTGIPGVRVWQRGYYDRVIRDEDEFQRIAEYIVTNPERWQTDLENVIT